jgi:hypothetical protein
MFELLLVACSLLLVSTLPAFAYLDPGTGSLVLQMLVAGALTAAASIRFFWSRIKDFVRRLFGLKTPPAGVP